MLCFEHTLADCLLFWCPLTCCTGAQLATCTALLLLLLPQEVGANLFVGGLDPEVDEKVGCCAALRCAVLCCFRLCCAVLCCFWLHCAGPFDRPVLHCACTCSWCAAGSSGFSSAAAAGTIPVNAPTAFLSSRSCSTTRSQHLEWWWAPQRCAAVHAVVRAAVCACVCQQYSASWYAACLQGQLA